MFLRLPVFFASRRDHGGDRRPSHGSERLGSDPRADDDWQHVRALRDADAAHAERGFAALFNTYHARLCDLAFRYLHSREEAEDVVQDVFTRLWRGRTTLQITDGVGAYLRTATRNTALNRLRHVRVETTWEGEQAGIAGHIVSATEEMLERAERHAVIARALAELPDRRRAICVLRWGKGLSYAEIAKQLGVGERTVETQLRRAIAAVRARLADG